MSELNAESTRRSRVGFSASKLGLLVVILSVLFIAGYIIINNYNNAKQVNSQIAQVIRDQHLRQTLLVTILKSTHHRSMILQKMTVEEDPFELDNLNQEFSEQAGFYIAAREKFSSLSLTDNELMLLNRHRELINEHAPKQNQVAELYLQGKRKEAIKLLYDQALPGQLEVFDQINLLLQKYNNDSIKFIEKVDGELAESANSYIQLGELLFFTSTIVIVIMLTRVSRKEEQQLSRALDELAEQKFALDQHAIVSIADVNGNITYVNERFCNISGYSEEELIGQNHRLIDSGEKDKAYWQQMYQTITNGKVWSDIVRNRAKDGAFFWVDATILPLLGKDQKPRSYISIRTDITERMYAEKALRRSQKMEAIGQLTGGIAHDFNNILNIILGNVELLSLYLPHDEKMQKRIQAIQKSTYRAAELTRQLLSFSSHHASNVSTANINSLIKEMDHIISLSITPLIEMKWNLADDVWLTEISSGDFEDSLLNLVINARDAMSGSGLLRIETRNCHLDNKFCDNKPGIKPGDYVQLSISDSGEGMSSEQLEHIFEPFYTTKEQGKGTGLGLAMVFGFIQRSQGHIEVDSTMGAGTSINLYLPRSNKSLSTLPLSSQPMDNKLPAGSETILLVDDEDDLREITREMLNDLGYHVLTAANAQQGLEILKTEPSVDLLISDVIMPGGMNGYQLVERASKDYPELKVMLISGYTESIDINENQKRFSHNVLIKPYSQAQLAQKVGSVFMTN